MSFADYERAQKSGKRDIIFRSARNENPYLPALDDIIKRKDVVTEVPLGLVQIPTAQIVGTKSDDRSNAFAANFMPILDIHTEFAYKWMSLCQSHMEEGIREPIKAYEYMNKFYVQEGNKRVSVLKFFGAVSVPGYVTRVIPPRTDEKENKIYYEFLDFYELSGINFISFSQEKQYAKLQRLVGKMPDEKWTDDEKLTFSSILSRFTALYNEDSDDGITVGDAFLSFIELYGYQDILDMSTATLKKFVKKKQKDLEVLASNAPLELRMDIEEKTNLLKLLLPGSRSSLRVAFIQEKSAETSAWTYAHELGRMHLEDTFGSQIQTCSYENATLDNIDDYIEDAIAQGNDIIFTTSPPLLLASVKAAIEHPEIKILNCSLNASHQYIRTYYARMYEAKFLMGAIAATMSESNDIGYIADYPIYGMVANINAFALGAKMINPRVKVHLKWSTMKNCNPLEEFKEEGISCILGQDMIVPGEASRYFGLFRMVDDRPVNLALPVWHWGKFYDKMIDTILKGSWKNDENNSPTKAINYWWGMSADAIEVICSQNLPIGTQRLIELLQETISRGEFTPFKGVLFSQNGIVQTDEHAVLSPEEIITMDWLMENVIGSIPTMDSLVDQAKPVILSQGVDTATAKE